MWFHKCQEHTEVMSALKTLITVASWNEHTLYAYAIRSDIKIKLFKL